MVLRRLSLRTRVIIILSTLGMIALTSGAAGLWYTHQMEKLFSEVTEQDMAVFQTLEELLQALIKQKGFVSYYFMDGNPNWLKQLDLYRKAFRDRLERAQRLVRTKQDRRALKEILDRYEKYIAAKDRVIDLYRQGNHARGLELHNEVRNHFFELLSLCEAYEAVNIGRIHEAHEESQMRASRIRIIASVSMLTAVSLVILFALILFLQILKPIRRLAAQADRYGDRTGSANEVKALSRGVRGLIEDADQTHSELEKSRVRLLKTEKMATVGKMAAGVAHSLRNPMTSIKMRLFSLERTLQVPPAQKEDLEVISEEIRHMNNIVENFLQYARPAKLKMQRISPSEIVDISLQLVKHRLRSYGIDLELLREAPLPKILADPDQVKEVIINILVNALEAMAGSGRISIEEKLDVVPPLGPVAIIRIRDNGPGIPDSIQEKVFEPFYSTKEEGTGLGLSIAVRIITQHGGLLNLKSREGEGTEFILTLPCRENSSWAPS